MMIAHPVDERRNVSAGVTLKGLGTAILAAKGLNNPTLDFFFQRIRLKI